MKRKKENYKYMKIYYNNGWIWKRAFYSMEENDQYWRITFPTPLDMPLVEVFRKNELIKKIEIIE